MSGFESVVNYMAFYPDKTYIPSVDDMPENVAEFTVSTEDNIKIYLLFFPAKNSDKLLLYFHGNAGNIYNRIPDLERIRNSGINVAGVSYRGYGKSQGHASEKGIYSDGKAVYNFLTADLAYSPGNIAIMGRSIGTTAAVNTAQNKEIAGLILVSPLTDAADQARSSGLGIFSWLAGNSFNNVSKLKNIDVPLLVIHGTNDRIISFNMGREIYNKYKGDKTFVAIEGGGHNDLQSTYADQYWDVIFRFLNKVYK